MTMGGDFKNTHGNTSGIKRYIRFYGSAYKRCMTLRVKTIIWLASATLEHVVDAHNFFLISVKLKKLSMRNKQELTY